MRIRSLTILCSLFAPFAAFAASEGVPVYYQNMYSNGGAQNSYGGYSSSGNKQVVSSSSYTYQVPRQTVPTSMLSTSAMTVNGIATPVTDDSNTSVYAKYVRRFADFQFKTSVNSVLEWDDMVFDEISVGAQHNFSLRDVDMFVYGQYSYGTMSHGGMSMDYDLEAFDESDPDYGIFTISVGDQSGTTNHFKLGIGAYNIWDIGGWKLSPSIGYEIFKHNLEMSDHYYPNEGIYLPLMTDSGDYVYADIYGNYYSVPIGTEVSDDVYQVCMSPDDIKLVQTSTSGFGYLGTEIYTADYDSAMGDIPWGVSSGECVIIGGDGEILVSGTTHIYNTTWSGFYIGLAAEKQMTLSDSLRFYFQFGMPYYSSEGTWPNRTDWQQNPSFIDEGDTGAYSYTAEMEYNMKLSERLTLALTVDTNLFYVGNIGGELYVAEYTAWVVDEYGDYVLDDYGYPILETVSGYTLEVADQLDYAVWQSFGLHLGFKYSF